MTNLSPLLWWLEILSWKEMESNIPLIFLSHWFFFLMNHFCFYFLDWVDVLPIIYISMKKLVFPSPNLSHNGLCLSLQSFYFCKSNFLCLSSRFFMYALWSFIKYPNPIFICCISKSHSISLSSLSSFMFFVLYPLQRYILDIFKFWWNCVWAYFIKSLS